MTSNVQVACAWMEEHPGLHRPTSIARHTGLTLHQASISCMYLWEMGRIERLLISAREGGRETGLYGILQGPARKKSRNPWTNEPLTILVAVRKEMERNRNE